MNDDRLEHLLRGYTLPEPSPALDARMFAQADRTFARARAEAAARTFADALGFGYLNYLIDLVTVTDAEYHVELI